MRGAALYQKRPARPGPRRGPRIASSRNAPCISVVPAVSRDIVEHRSTAGFHPEARTRALERRDARMVFCTRPRSHAGPGGRRSERQFRHDRRVIARFSGSVQAPARCDHAPIPSRGCRSRSSHPQRSTMNRPFEHASCHMAQRPGKRLRFLEPVHAAGGTAGRPGSRSRRTRPHAARRTAARARNPGSGYSRRVFNAGPASTSMQKHHGEPSAR